MRHRIARLFEPLLRLLLPGRGRRRLVAARADREAEARHAAGPTARRVGSRLLRGEDNTLVRPYLVAHELMYGLEVTG